MAGRKKIPSKLKMIKGTYRNGRENPDEPFPDENIPEPPAMISGDALKEWNRITPELHANGLISNLDMALVVMYCKAWERYKKYEKIVEEKGELIKTVNGSIQMSPAMWVLNKAWEQVYKSSTEIGLSTQSRARIPAQKAGKKKDPWKKFGAK